jgi:hypothetical protein
VTIRYVRREILFSGLGGRKAPNSIDKISIVGVLRLRATKCCSRDKSVGRSAQDDDSVGVLKKTKNYFPPFDGDPNGVSW